MNVIFKKYWWLILLFLIVIPLLVEGGISYIPWNGSDDGWLGFWGGYLGAIISIVGIYWSVNQQINFENKRREPMPIPIEGRTHLYNVKLDNHKLKDSSEMYKGIDSFCDLDIPILNAGNSIMYNCRCTYKLINLEELKKKYNLDQPGDKKVGSKYFYLYVVDEKRIIYEKHDSSMDGTVSILDYSYKDWEYTIPFIDSKKYQNVKLPIITPFFIKLLAYETTIKKFSDDLDSYFPKFKVTFKYLDAINHKEHTLIYKLKFGSVSIQSRGSKKCKI